MGGKSDGSWCVSKHRFVASNEDELSFESGISIKLLQQPEGGWWEGKLGASSGWFPANHVTEIAGVRVGENDQCLAITDLSSISDLWMDLITSENKLVQRMDSFWTSFLKPLQEVTWLAKHKIAMLTTDFKKAMATHKEFLHALAAETTTAQPNIVENVMFRWLPSLGICATGCAATASECMAICECKSLMAGSAECNGMSSFTAEHPASSTAFMVPVQRITEYVQYVERLKTLTWAHNASMIDAVTRFHDAILVVAATVEQIQTSATLQTKAIKVVVTPDVCAGAPFLPPSHKSGGLTSMSSFGDIVLRGGPMQVYVGTVSNTGDVPGGTDQTEDGIEMMGLDAAAVVLFTGRLAVFTTQLQPREGEDTDVANGNILYECAMVVPLSNADVYVDERQSTIIHVNGVGIPSCALQFETTEQSALWASELYDQTVENGNDLDSASGDGALLSMIRPLGLGWLYRARVEEVQDRAEVAAAGDSKRSGAGRRWRFRRTGDGSQRGNVPTLPKRTGQTRSMSLDTSAQAARDSALMTHTALETSGCLSEYVIISTYGTSTA